MEFIVQLKKEHVQILKGFKTLSSKKNSLPVLTSLGKLLERHLKKENEVLYPALLGSSHVELQQLGRSFSSAMMAYSKDIEKIFGEYYKAKKENNVDKKVLDKLKAITQKIKDRVTIEENILFPAYEKFLD